jgi:hypothetical protein
MAISERYLLDILQKQKALLEAILINQLPPGATLSYGPGDCGEWKLTVHPPVGSRLARLLIRLKLKKEPAGPIMMASPEVNEYVIREGGTTSIQNAPPDPGASVPDDEYVPPKKKRYKG